MSEWKFNKDGWTNWITHDGSGCPCVGMYVGLETHSKVKDVPSNYKITGECSVEGVPIKSNSQSWCWVKEFSKVVRYRVRKPKGLTMLENLLEDLPVTKEVTYEQA